MDDENSEGELFKLQSSWDGASKLKKTKAKAGPIDDHFAPFAASSANARESMEVELAIKWSQQGFFFAARVLGKLSRMKARGERLGEDAGKDTCLQSNEYFCDAVCGDIARKTSSPDVYQEQENF